MFMQWNDELTINRACSASLIVTHTPSIVRDVDDVDLGRKMAMGSQKLTKKRQCEELRINIRWTHLISSIAAANDAPDVPDDTPIASGGVPSPNPAGKKQKLGKKRQINKSVIT
jgi:hypothetical protein